VEPIPSASRDPFIGQVIEGRYRVLNGISRGTMGRVYRAEQLLLGRMVAIKVMAVQGSLGQPDEQAANERRFLNEAAALARLEAPNTVRIFDFGVWEGQPYLVMEYVEAHNLDRILRREGRLPPGRAVQIAVQIGRSLREAHRLGIVHRDLKPANILVKETGDDGDLVKVVDFGLVVGPGLDPELTRAGRLVGSPNHMSPEQIREQPLDGRSDIYALGVLIFRMVTGRVPFPREGAAAVLSAHLHDPPPRMDEVVSDPRIAEPLEAVVARTLEKDPNLRHADVHELMVDLERCLPRPVPVAPPPPPPAPVSTALVVGGLAAAALALLVLLGLLLLAPGPGAG